MIFSCKSENQNSDLTKDKTTKKDSIFEIEEPDYFQYSEYKVGHVNDGYGKRLYIDSLHFNIVKLFYKSDSTKIQYEFYDDFVNDTILNKEYYKNGNLKEIKKYTYIKKIPIRKWIYYNNDGTIRKIVDHSEKHKISFDSAMKIAIKNGIVKPYETELSPDSLKWRFLNWKVVEYDSIENETKELGKGIIINRKTGEIEKTESNRTSVE